jgi:hypothetical protein
VAIRSFIVHYFVTVVGAPPDAYAADVGRCRKEPPCH